MLGRMDFFEPEEDDLEGYSKHISSQVIKFMMLYTAGLVPLVRDVMRSVVTGYQPSYSPIFDMAEAATKSLKGLSGVAFQEEELTRADIKGLAKAAGLFLGIPIAQTLITTEAGYDFMQGEDIRIYDLFLHRSRGGLKQD